jgi:hypothetical protein
LKLVLTADKAVYAPNEPIRLTLKVVNETPKLVSLSFLSAQRFDLIIQDQQGREVWRWSAGRVFAQILGEEMLKPSGGEFLSRAMVSAHFAHGVYTVRGIIPALEGAMSTSIPVTVQ